MLARALVDGAWFDAFWFPADHDRGCGPSRDRRLDLRLLRHPLPALRLGRTIPIDHEQLINTVPTADLDDQAA